MSWLFLFLFIDPDTTLSNKPPSKTLYAGLEELSEKLPRVWWDRQWVGACRPKDIRQVVAPVRIPLENADGSLRFVIPIRGKVNSGFGFRRGWQFHFGLDIDLQVGDTVVAAMDGEVRLAGYDPLGYGYFCVIAHPNGLETVYGHFSYLMVQPEQMVKAGEPIGLGGSTGWSTGPHLHFEIRFMGEPIDFSALIDFPSGELIEKEIFISAQTFDHLSVLRDAIYHIVRRGESLYLIARRYGVTVRYLCALNGLSPRSVIRPGQRLRVR
ncbi:MAG: M23 family metallopeptidase [Bacteroidia bacterium]|nr:M23 family metallopeptidase [Bacteroidia bacterium]MDW8235772.1 M23 family metallopeptidase [Bacteroidia bacterium]